MQRYSYIAAAAGQPLVAEGKHGWHDENIKRRTRPYSELRLAEHGLRVDVPRRSFAALVASDGGSLLGGLIFLSFTALWVSASMGGNAPLPFVLFSTPFWFAGATMLSTGLAPLLNDAAFAIHADGMQLELRTVQAAAVQSLRQWWRDGDVLTDAAHECTLIPWLVLAATALGDDVCSVPPSEPGAIANALEKALLARVTSVVNGHEHGDLWFSLSGETPNGISWGGGLLSIAQLRALRKLAVAWARAHDATVLHAVHTQCRTPRSTEVGAAGLSTENQNVE